MSSLHRVLNCLSFLHLFYLIAAGNVIVGSTDYISTGILVYDIDSRTKIITNSEKYDQKTKAKCYLNVNTP